MTLIWAAALVTALLWPSHVIGPLDGAPLETPLEAIVIAIVIPILWMLDPHFLRTTVARTLIVVAIGWKIGTAMLLTPQGWCGEFLTPYPAPGSYRLDRSWDLRTYLWPGPTACSSIVSRGYDTLGEFPGWNINIPFDGDWILGTGPIAVPPSPPLPADGEYRMIVSGWMRPAEAGTLSFELGDGVATEALVDGVALPMTGDRRAQLTVGGGEHNVVVRLGLTGDRWRFVPRWNDRDLFTAIPTTLGRSTVADRLAGRWSALIAPALILLLIAGWLFSIVRVIQPDPALLGWLVASLACAAIVGALHRDLLVRWGVLGLLAAAAVRVPQRLRTWRGAMVLIGLPWLTVFVVRSIPQVGRFTIFSQGDDWLTFQRFAYRIFMRGYWLEGGEPTFWYQPFYRWTTGVLHLVFGDSSVGDLYWDIFGLLIGALFAFLLASRIAGFRIGIIAAAVTLATVTLGPNWYVIGRGLSEISSSAWLLLSAMTLIRARSGQLRYAVVAAAFAGLAFYTRLNHLPLAIVMVAFTLPDELSAGSWLDLRTVWARLPKRVAAVYLACFALAVAGFALRTYHYTGRFSVFAGTTLTFNGTGLGLTADSVWSPDVWRRAFESVAMIVTVQDPPRLDPRSIFVVAGVGCALLALIGTPLVRRLPLHLAIVCVGAIAGGLFARGLAYPGRFSIHLIPLAVTASTTVAALALGAGGPHEQRSSAS